jgi:hypothetical protein
VPMLMIINLILQPVTVLLPIHQKEVMAFLLEALARILIVMIKVVITANSKMDLSLALILLRTIMEEVR